MKTGKVARTFRVDPKTVVSWTDTFAEFFTLGAQSSDKSGLAQREYTFDDLLALNTIRGLKAQRLKDDEIRDYLAKGERDEDLPHEATSIQGENAVAIYTQMKALQIRLENAEGEAERLRREITERDNRHRDEIHLKDERIEKLNREIGELTAELRILRNKSNDE